MGITKAPLTRMFAMEKQDILKLFKLNMTPRLFVHVII